MIFLSSLAGTLVGLPLMLRKREGSRMAIPFGPFLSLGAIIYLMWGEKLLDAYYMLWSSG